MLIFVLVSWLSCCKVFIVISSLTVINIDYHLITLNYIYPTYACMCACMYVCMYVCMCVWCVCACAPVYACMSCMFVCMHACM